MADRRKAGWPGRMKGSSNPSAKLDEGVVRRIRRLLSASVPQREIASRFGVSQSAIMQISTKRKWQWLS
jgi:DNA invertase Pin-like site-specific DNA recombinase